MRIVFIILFLIVQAELLYAQFTELSGLVYDAATNLPIEKVEIKLINSDIHTYTDLKGHFHFINVPRDTFTIIFQKSGYLTEKRAVDLEKTDVRDIRFRLIPISYETPTVFVTDKSYRNKFDEIHDFTGSIENAELVKELGNTVASTLSNEVGVSIRSMGPAPARPVIRGLGGDRIAMAEDGLNIVDMSATSADHAVTVDPAAVERIEIARGPKILINTSSTIGGVVNIIKEDVPMILNDRITGTALLFGETVNTGYNGAFTINLPYRKFEMRATGSYRKTGNLNVPEGVVENSQIENYNYSLGTGYIEEDYSIGAAISEFSSNYGIPGGFVGVHPKGVNIEMLRRLIQAKGLFHFRNSIFDVVNIDFGRTYYRHKEFESNGTIGAEYLLKDYSGKIIVNQHPDGIFREGSFGVSFSSRELGLGGYVFTPPTNTLMGAAYIYQSIKLGKHYLEMGLRYGFNQLKPEWEDSTKIGFIRKRVFNTLSASISIMHEITKNIYVGANISKTSRAPSAEELYSLGPHLASYSYEVGNPNLEQESGYGSELFSFVRFNDITLSLTGFYNYMDYYIITQNTGKLNIAQLLPIYAYMGVPAVLEGFEFSMNTGLTRKLSLRAVMSYTYAENTNTNSPLPFIPPFKGNINLDYSIMSELSVAVKSDFAAAQNRTGEFEESTAGYIVFDASANYRFTFGDYLNIVSLSIDNIFDQSYKNHLSRLKSVYPEPGRNLRITYKLNF